MKEYEKIFLKGVLGHDDGPEAIRYWERGWTPRSESGIESALNAGVEAVAKALQERLQGGVVPLLESLMVLDRFRPVTQKQSRARYYLCPGLEKAMEAHADACALVYAALPQGAEAVLREDLLPAIWRARVLKREPTTSIATPTVELARNGPEDRWVLKWQTPLRLFEPFRRGPGVGIYVQLGHLSSRRLRIETVRQPAADGREVTSIVIHHDGLGCHNPDCRLPVAAEIIHGAEDDGGSLSLWREIADPHEATLPHVGRKVRIGNVVLTAMPYEDTAEARAASAMFTFPTPRLLGGWEGRVFTASASASSAEAIKFMHPDHYEVSVQILPGEVVAASPVRGQTQYVPAGYGSGD